MLPRFWRKIKYRYNLIGTKCENCGRTFYPPRNLCPECRRKSSIVEVELGDTGVVLSYSVVHDAPESMKLERPYIVGLIRLDSGVVVTSQIVCDPEDVRIGMRVRAAFRRYGEDGEDGIIYYGTKFVPVEE
ncbi:putative nucleic-acid-binding protein containing a Zn-ribbon [Geoglobus ahangari]|uniref:Putative nucleic-acid-binding protein containing a Zn-ribbon n=1 Tax=Geoglobus ahangari TaxID=113653 RepID=A0A0F7DBC2_9EURY|nr:putative nucleic-acid-binding protein containing a Zn-ribbon [Geoglobus ahangari]NOY11759.1 Zn-ribbon domain-containing OB-fold protein [Archaeoglobi archaeon]